MMVGVEVDFFIMIVIEDQVKCIKNEEGNILVANGDIKERQRNYFHKLFDEELTTSTNAEYLVTREEDQNLAFYRRIREVEVKDALKKMDNRKSMVPNNVPIETRKYLGGKGTVQLTKLFNEILRFKRMLEEWRRSAWMPIYKNK